MTPGPGRTTLAALACALTLGGSPSGGAATAAIPGTGGATAARDTTVAVSRGDALALVDLEGELVIEAWGRSEVRIVDLDEPGARVSLRRTSEGLTLRGRRRSSELRVEVPSWLPLEVRGRELDLDVRGTTAALLVRTVEGEVFLHDVSGRIDVHALDGEIRASDVAGDVELRSVDDDVTVRGARGRLRVASTDGDLTLEDVDVEALEATTTDGDVTFSGVFHRGGSYALVTHSGDVFASIPADADLDVFVSTFDGGLEARFPITLDGIRSGRETRFTLGAGGARLSLEAFDGDIVLRRPGGG